MIRIRVPRRVVTYLLGRVCSQMMSYWNPLTCHSVPSCPTVAVIGTDRSRSDRREPLRCCWAPKDIGIEAVIKVAGSGYLPFEPELSDTSGGGHFTIAGATEAAGRWIWPNEVNAVSLM